MDTLNNIGEKDTRDFWFVHGEVAVATDAEGDPNGSNFGWSDSSSFDNTAPFSVTTIRDLKVDSMGNIYVAGMGGAGTYSFWYSTRLDPNGNEQSGYRDIQRTIGGDSANAIVIDPDDNVYIGGTARGLAGSGSPTDDFRVRKFDSQGNLKNEIIWDFANSNNRLYELALDNAGGLYLAGSTFDPTTQEDWLILKYDLTDPEGQANGWIRSIDGATNTGNTGAGYRDEIHAMYVHEASGSLILGGFGTANTALSISNNWIKKLNTADGNIEFFSLYGNNFYKNIIRDIYYDGTDIYFAGLESETSVGSPVLYSLQKISASSSPATAPTIIDTGVNGNIAFESTANKLIVDPANNAKYLLGFGTDVIAGGSGQDAVIKKFNASDTIDFERAIDFASGSAAEQAIAGDINANGDLLIGVMSGQDGKIVKYNPLDNTTNYQGDWSVNLNLRGGLYDSAVVSKIAGDGSLYVAGVVEIHPGDGGNPHMNGFIKKYDSQRQLVSQVQFDYNNLIYDDCVKDMIIDSNSGDIYITGYKQNRGTSNKCHTVSGYSQLFIQKFDSNLSGIGENSYPIGSGDHYSLGIDQSSSGAIVILGIDDNAGSFQVLSREINPSDLTLVPSSPYDTTFLVNSSNGSAVMDSDGTRYFVVRNSIDIEILRFPHGGGAPDTFIISGSAEGLGSLLNPAFSSSLAVWGNNLYFAVNHYLGGVYNSNLFVVDKTTLTQRNNFSLDSSIQNRISDIDVIGNRIYAANCYGYGLVGKKAQVLAFDFDETNDSMTVFSDPIWPFSDSVMDCFDLRIDAHLSGNLTSNFLQIMSHGHNLQSNSSGPDHIIKEIPID